MEQSERESWLAGEVASSELKWPAGQVVQEEEEDVPEKVPFGHVVHVAGLVAPMEELDVPAMQAVTSEGLGNGLGIFESLFMLHLLSSHLDT